ncbi:hypothetical protein SOVF_104600 [Spinacia oleracea]|nr:hypothetical protein SOVF_104600 [Spinacia oleracea]
MTHEKVGDRRSWRNENQNVASAQILKVQAENRSILLNAEKIIQNCGRYQSLLDSGEQDLERFRQDSKKLIAECASVREKVSAVNGKKSTDGSSEVPQIVQQEDDETLMKLAETQKIELDDLHKRILDLQNQLEAKQGLDLILETLKSIEAGCEKLQGKREEFHEKEEEVEGLETLATALIVNEQRVKGELHEAREALMDGLKDFSSPTIGTKILGQLDSMSFVEACKRKYPIEIAEVKAVELCSLWEANLKDPDWHPFKTILAGGVYKDIDMEDERLKNLKNEWGEDVYTAVASAMKELNEYNPKKRLPVKELWNYELNRKASLTEGAEVLLQKWRNLKRRRRSVS